jgi:hypothetical protein
VFLFARNFISESFLVVGQILIIKRQAFDLTTIISVKIERSKRVQYWTQIKCVEYKICCHEKNTCSL